MASGVQKSNKHLVQREHMFVARHQVRDDEQNESCPGRIAKINLRRQLADDGSTPRLGGEAQLRDLSRQVERCGDTNGTLDDGVGVGKRKYLASVAVGLIVIHEHHRRDVG